MTEPEKKSAVPEDIQRRLAEAAAAFVVKTGASVDDVREFMLDIITIHTDYMGD